MRDRRVARFLVAPAGFGKTALAFEYADTVFSFEHVFWLNGRSPCFLRDLDAGGLAEAVFAADSDVQLVVCEDVPRLDGERVALFGGFVDTLLERGAEVLVTCTPSADVFSGLQRDRMMLIGADLLLNDKEMAVEEASGRVVGGWERACAQSERVACLRWNEDGVNMLLDGLRCEELPADVRLALLALLVLEEGTNSDVEALLPPKRAREALSLLEEGYACVGVDSRTGTYRAARMDIEQISTAFARRFGELARASLLDGRDALGACVADMLLERGLASRACQFEAAFATRKGGAAWLAARGWTLVARGEFQPLCILHASVTRGASGMHEPLAVLRAWAAFALDDMPFARSQANRLYRLSSANVFDRLRAAVLLARCCKEQPDAQVIAVLKDLSRHVADKEGAHKALDASLEGHVDWTVLAEVVSALCSDAGSALAVWTGIHDKAFSGAAPDRGVEDALLLAASWILEDACENAADEQAKSAHAQEASLARRGLDARKLDALMRFAGAMVEKTCTEGSLSWFALRAGLAAEQVTRATDRLQSFLPSASAVALMHAAELSFLEQRDAYRRAKAAQVDKRRQFHLTHPDAFRADDGTSPLPAQSYTLAAPMLYVKLFGGMEVRIGDAPVNDRAFARRKAKTLLALLVLLRGREVSRDRLSSLLWPDVEADAARRNFYTVWSQLRRVLTVGEVCPYLVRSSSGCRVDAHLVSSDVYEFDAFARTLLFEAVDPGDWERLYAQACDSYGEDLMPCEEDNEVISSLRNRYRTQLVDGLVAASLKLGRIGEVQGALWFAREALRRDAAREDVYARLMEAQIDAGQRGAALETYFACRRFLSGELGIDPSMRLVDLYRSVIEIEQAV